MEDCICQCGCGKPTGRWDHTDEGQNRYRGECKRFIVGHINPRIWRKYSNPPIIRRGEGKKVAYWRRHLRNRYGITLEDYNTMLESQNGVCAACKTPSDTTRRLCVDHCHNTGKIRGLLCFKCNAILGLSHDSIDILRSAIDYIENNTCAVDKVVRPIISDHEGQDSN